MLLEHWGVGGLQHPLATSATREAPLRPAWGAEQGVRRQDGAGATGEGTQLEQGAPGPAAISIYTLHIQQAFE